ncbi:MAG: sugar phosphate isomerase/epimerase [Nitrososphaerota archaeon]|nr:sugar phosphate isomerase/epimerase [Candidatus Calditenuaceae archaeon]MDW8073199.1 sugar phosphate isomerase/epimerase [Nitrososphaerota archaeon]
MKLSLERLIFMRRPIGEFLTYTRSIGFEGVEFAESELQRHRQERNYGYESLAQDVERRGLKLSGIYWSADFHRSEDRASILSQSSALAEAYSKMGCRYVVIGPPRGGLSEGLAPTQVFKLLDELVKTLKDVSKIFVDHGVKPVLHNHYDTLVETKEELDQVLTCIEPELLGFCPDTAHLALAGMDPLQTIHKYLDRITYVHLKDIKTFAGEGGRLKRWWELTTELGRGVIDFPAIIKVLRTYGKVEWLVVEQDYSDKTPEESVKESLDYITPLVKGV